MSNVKYMIVVLSLFTCIFSFSQIAVVGGLQTSNRTFVKDTTYIIHKDLIIPNGIVLTIEPGTTVKINYNIYIIIDDGTLIAQGTESDSIRFIANHSNPGQFWKWSGIVMQNINSENPNHINYAHISEAETAIMLEDSKNIIVQNTTMTNCQNMGVHIYNSSYCYIVNCSIEQNYNGIELYAGYLGNTSDNLILNTKLSNENHNIYIIRENGGLYQNNIISNNIIANGNNGIWIDNNGGTVNSENVISKNIIINNGLDVGYGIFLAHDSTIVTNNIFWNNNIAILSEDKGNNCSVLNNSFYKNKYAIQIGAGSEGNKIFNNTFALNEIELFGFKEVNNTEFNNNNLVYNTGFANIVVNATADDIDIPHNYWGTQSVVDIDKYIYDNNDNPSIGSVIYEPITISVDTTNPVAPPYKPIKQLVNNAVRVSWNSNEDADIRAYNIYYGDFEYYSFNQYEVVENDTSYVLFGDISIYDNIAVTAIDSTSKGTDSQVDGHESPFAFAELYPFAGNDSVICKFQQELEITDSNIPFEYQKLYWSTIGDGIFNDPLLLQPTYYPGEMDKLEGGTVLFLNVVTETDTIVDSFGLSIIEDPFSFAGNDTIIVADTALKLMSSIALNYKSVKWLTGGDGVFSNDTLVNTIYSPGDLDKELGKVFIELIAYSECGVASDSMRVTIEPHYSIEGKLWTSGRSPYQGVVLALFTENNVSRATLINETQTDGSFRFPKVMKGNYYIYALPDTNNLDNLAPGYYANKLRWQSAYLLPVDADVYDIDILLPSLDVILPNGDASITGHMEIPSSSRLVEDIYCTPWFNNSNNMFCNGGLSNITILLFNSTKSKLLHFTLTDELGNFYFKNLPFGDYIVDAEKANYLVIPSPIITLSPDYPHESGVSLEINNNKIGIDIIGSFSNNNIDVYPVPASGELYMPIQALGSEVRISIYDIFGNRVMEFDQYISENSNNLKIDIQSLPIGLYFGNVISSSKISKFRFIIR